MAYPATYAHPDGRTRLVAGVADKVKAEFDGFRPSEPQAVEAEFNPGSHTVAEVLAYLEGGVDAQERQRVLDSERSGKNRAALVG